MFKKLWTIHAQIGIWVIPLASFLLPEATKAIYTRVFSILHSTLSLLSPDNNNDAKKTPHTCANHPATDKDQATLDSEEKVRLRTLGPHMCIMDFEPAQFNAFEQLFSGEVQECHFHFHQAISCNVQSHAKLSRLIQSVRAQKSLDNQLAFLEAKPPQLGNPYQVFPRARKTPFD
ncbi:hypothetical protein DSO57_1019874 [Entomophthora muscae]|uniref:Uncharacterized protein n=1 Tax=Entomophthora muscae TaxID=34485 RepID=A0ACC2T429_9FUNG|nr:hypothetical protein DSO57_1019874 [Entomophthora muscae]